MDYLFVNLTFEFLKGLNFCKRRSFLVQVYVLRFTHFASDLQNERKLTCFTERSHRFESESLQRRMCKDGIKHQNPNAWPRLHLLLFV